MLHNADDSPAPAPTWNPPPHLEARFSRKRRRPTGAHSPCAVPLTTASTLATTRRQLLLDSRKSLLRQRAQHVEKVRRARANSHEAVGARLLALQQALSQAQESRNAILARIAGSCASEVAKAKRLAGETRERREREARALRSGVEERMLEAERRRMEVLSERRGRKRTGAASGAAVRLDGVSDVEEEEPVARAALRRSVEETRGEAARRIQRAWRAHVRGEIVKRFLGLGLTIESVRDTSFEDISNRFQEEGVQKATARLLKLCGLLGSPVADAEGEVDVEVACRTFLSAYLILGHPAEVLSNDGDNEKALITKSKDLLIAFESFLSAPTFPPAKHLAETWESFSTAFTSWKARDSEILVSTMVAQYAELDLIWQKVKDDTEEHVAADFKEGIRENQLILLVRIRRLAGEKTRGLIRQAVKEARRTRLPKKEKGDTRPRETPSSSESNAVSAAVTAAQAGAANTPASPIADQPSIPTAAAVAPPTHEDPTHDDTFSQFSATSGALSNRQIVHELALNRDFKLTQRQKPPLEQLVEREAKRAFWDLMRADVLQGRNLAKWLPPMAHSVRTKLLHLLDPAGSLHRTIADAIDVDLIAQQCQHGTYDHERFFAFVLALLPRICSPARDGDVQALLGHTGDYIDRLQRLFDVLELLQLDHANFLLMASAQYVIPEAAPYERRLFSADLAAGRTSLTRTTAWLRAAQVAARAEAEAAGRARPTPIQVWNHAFLGLVATLDTALLTPDTAPETLHLDVDRINGFRHTFRTIVIGAAITITTKNLLRRDVRSAWRPLKERVAALLAGAAVEGGEDGGGDGDGDGDGGAAALADGICVFLTETVATPKSVLGHVAGAVGRIVARGGADPVVRVVAGRVRGFVGERLGAEGSRERVRLATGGGETLSGFGVAEWIGEVGGLVDAVVGCGGVNRDVYREWYDAVLVE